MNRKRTHSIFCLIIAVLLIIPFFTQIPTVAKEEMLKTQHFKELMEKGKVSETYGAEISGSNLSFINPSS